MTFTAVVTVHDGDPTKIITNLLTQTRRPDEILVYMSGAVPAQSYSVLEDAPGFEMFIVPNRDDWGHEKRAMGLDRATCEFIGWFNHDDEYDPPYLQELLDEAENGADVVYCNWTQGARQNAGNAEFRAGSSTSGNWIARTSLVREAGYRSRQYSADGLLIDDVAALKPPISKIDKTHYHHNP